MLRHSYTVTWLVALTLFFTACGSAGNGPVSVDPIEGPYVQVLGSTSTTFRIGENTAKLTCSPKTGTHEFEFRAENDEGHEVHLRILGFVGSGHYELEYSPLSPAQQVHVALAGGYGYEFLQAIDADTGVVLPSVCSATIQVTASGDVSRFDGALSCVRLYAEADSIDFDGVGRINYSIDLVMRFSCSY
jgi:hypothetical protein